METVKLSLITIGLLTAQALLWLVLSPFRAAVALFSKLANSAVSFSQWFRVKVALFVLPAAKLHARIAEASELGVKALIDTAYGE